MPSMTLSRLARAAAAAALVTVAACQPFAPSTRYQGTPMFVVQNVDAARLSGTWYEVARFPAPFQAGCYATTAEYTVRPDGLIGVRNSCRVMDAPGQVRRIDGTARLVGPGQLAVRLEGVPVTGRFWVLDLSRDGRMLIVGTPGREAGWVLRRDPRVTPEQMDRAREVFRINGYDVAALQRTRHGAFWTRTGAR